MTGLDLLGVDAILSDEEREIRAVVAKLVADRVRPHIAAWYEQAAMPVRELARELGSIGLLGMHLTGYGCAGATATAYGLACQELEAGDSAIRSLVSVQGSLAMYAIWRHGSEEQKRQWLPRMATGELLGCFGLTEPDHGSDPAAMTTRATRDGGDWLLTGVKTWITSAPVADLAVIWARTPDRIAGFLVPLATPGVAVREIRQKLSLRASATGEIVLDQVRLPADARLPGALSGGVAHRRGAETPDLARASGLGAALACLTQARYGIVWGALGAARDCLETTLQYATTRTQFGRPIAGFQLTQAKLADMAVELGTGQLLALHLGRAADAGRLTPVMVSAGKLANVRTALGIARQCRTILGASGISGEYPLMRHANNLESVLTYEGTSEIHQLIVGEHLTGESAFT